jgi:prepilin-type N-terminal cleavage/methylation domain-containing protein
MITLRCPEAAVLTNQFVSLRSRQIRQKGFTLIELMISIAILVILVGAVFSINFRISGLWSSERARSQLQQNFRFAGDMISNELRQAVAVMSPSDQTMEDELRYDYWNSTSRGMQRVIYRRDGTDPGPYRVVRLSQPMTWDTSKQLWVASGTWSTPQPVTEDIDSLAALHFIRSGGRVVVILVAKYQALGREQTVGYTMQVFTRGATGGGG